LSCLEPPSWFILILAAILLPSLVEADEFRLLPSIAQTLQYNDNIYVTPSQPLHDFISTTTGGIELFESTEKLNLDVSGLLSENLYQHTTSLDSTDGSGGGSIHYSVNPQLALSATGSYSRASQPGQQLLTTGLVLNGVTVDTTTYHAQADYVLTEKTAASLFYDHDTIHYQSSLFSDVTSDAGTLSLTHDLSQYLPQVKGLLNMSYTQYSLTGTSVDNLGATTVNNYEATTGFSYAVKEKWSIQASAGLRRTDSSFETLVPTGFIFGPFFFVTGFTEQTQTTSGWGGVGQASLSYKGEVTNASFGASRDVAPAAGQGGTVERTSFTLSANRKLSYDFSGFFDAGYFINKSAPGQFSVAPIDFETLNVSPRIRYEFGHEGSGGSQSGRDMYVEASYTFTRLEDKIGQTTAYRNLFIVRFFAQHAVLE
jgi:hypothetical protein